MTLPQYKQIYRPGPPSKCQGWIWICWGSRCCHSGACIQGDSMWGSDI